MRQVDLSPDAARALDGPPWLKARREEAASRLAAASLPTGEEEIWRYGRVGDLDLTAFVPAPASRHAGSMPTLPPPAQALVDRIGDRSGFAVTENGTVVQAHLGDEGERGGARLKAASGQGAAPELWGAIACQFEEGDATDALDDLAAAFVRDGTVLSVPRGVEIKHPVVIVNLIATAGERENVAAFPRTVVSVGDGASVSVVELFVSGDGPVLAMPVVELSLGDGARLSYSAVQQLGPRTWQLGRSFAAAGRDATLKCFTASLGAEYARARMDSRLAGQGGSAELLAVYLGDDHQVHDFRTLQEHAAARTTSDLVFKGAVGGSARSVYSGLIRMRHGARGANAFQTNRNLVLSDGAHADSVPNLDIQENDVRCSHASAVGPIDPEQRFYLQSRGVPREAAERLILLGYFEELLERVDRPVRDHVVASIRGRVHAITGSDAAT